ncbi:hypothetical protein OEZ85_010262 [Tetradesmus obliquus]|uniref:Mannosyl-oligosaccharide glucosidase n=1 Tax=Tetradesmus obliquus TaxID=3088 RepID=A0ABY8TNV3_TETOB|nr:hypothetical protein OEZ85_010262 [Tetradesmus obliquus]
MAPKPAKTASGRAKSQPSRSSSSQSKNISRLLIIAAVNVAGLIGYASYKALVPYVPPEITPLKAPRMKELQEFGSSYQNNMLWGSYRSGLYFGMRTRTARPLLLGMMWFDPTDAATVHQEAIRHEAQQGDKLSSYGWVRHDGRSYGRQEIADGDFQLTVQMVKHRSEGSGYGGDWAVRVSVALTAAGRAKQDAAKAAAEAEGRKAAKRKLSLVFYFADAHWRSSELEMWPEQQQSKLGEGVQLLSGDNEDVGPWALHLRPGPSQTGSSSSSSSSMSKSAASSKLQFLGMRLQDGQQLVQLKQLMLQALVQNAQRLGFENGLKLWLPDIAQPRPNLAAFQVTAAVPSCFDLVFVTQPEGNSAAQRLAALSGASLSRLAAERESLFDERFALTFPISNTPEDTDAAALQEVSKAALSNLLGSMGFFVGASKVKLPPGSKPYSPPGSPPPQPGQDPLVVDYWREALFTATPSRSFFPRGFLWDEGFHQLLVQRWDPQLSRDAIAHWLDLMNCQGWIPREQILGKEARTRVPAEFMLQHPSHANPPSLYLPLLAHALSAAAAEPDHPEVLATQAFLKRAWPRLEVWYNWFNTSQAGQQLGTYMWKGRDAASQTELNPKTLMSGLDDYPRASHPSPEERHVDLHAWMALASSAMAEIGRVAGAPAKAVAKYAAAAEAIGSMQRLRELHYDAASGQFRDYGLHSEAVEMVWRNVPVPEGAAPKRELVRQVNEPPQLQLVPCFGYVSLFPLMMQLLPPESRELGQQLQLLRQEQLLWTSHGLRSLAPTSSIYKKYNTEHDAPYWRGQIWINLNYLTLRALKHYSSTAGPHQEAAAQAYADLRANLLRNLAGQYHSTGYLWEQYDDTDGRPKGSHPFTGWTALLTLIASEAF